MGQVNFGEELQYWQDRRSFGARLGASLEQGATLARVIPCLHDSEGGKLIAVLLMAHPCANCISVELQRRSSQGISVKGCEVKAFCKKAASGA